MSITKRFIPLLLLLAFLVVASPACSPKYGCPSTESVHVKPNRKGNLPSKGGNSGLFPKDVKKKSKVRG
ncbi:MAG: hypothetical protein KDC44_03870 [Phaeodactylibacter sp.]|nr:hypothetical protein [Phaeodactylibacter sp.]